MREEKLYDIIYYVGRNAKENWELLDNMKLKNDKYIWFHLNSFASPYVIMEASIDDIEEQKDISGNKISSNIFLTYGAELCKKYSKYKFMNNIKIMYVNIDKLTKSDKIGAVNVKGKVKLLTL